MLSEDIKKEIDKYNQDKKAQDKPNHSRMAKVHEQEHEQVDDGPEHLDPDPDNRFHEESYPMQDSEIGNLLENHTPYTVNMASTYHIYKHSASSYGSLVDRGANGGLVRADVHVLERTGRKVSVTGIDGHELPGLDIATCVALIKTNHGKVNMLMHEYMHTMVEVIPSILPDRWNGSKTPVMTIHILLGEPSYNILRWLCSL